MKLSLRQLVTGPFRFMGRVMRDFRANQGFLLSGAVAYYTLLSIVPMLALIVVVLSQVVDRYPLLEITQGYLELLAPGESGALVAQVVLFLDNWQLIGIVGVVILVFFSSLAFTVLENAMSVIFFHRVAIHRRHFLVSAVLPYLFILLLALGLLIVSVGSSALQVASWEIKLFGSSWKLDWLYSLVLYLSGVFGEFLLLTSLYLVLPVGRITTRHAIIGGIVATALWEITRHLLVWYYTTLSLVNMIYGSLASIVMLLVSFDFAAIILLFGAQVIAEFERSRLPSGKDIGGFATVDEPATGSTGGGRTSGEIPGLNDDEPRSWL